MTGDALNVDLDGHVAGGSDDQQVCGPAVPVERELWLAQPADRNVPRPDKADFLLHGPEQGQGRMRQIVFENLQSRGEHDTRPCAIVSAESCRRFLRPNDRTVANGLAAHAERHSINVRHHQPPGASHCARQFADQIANLPADPTFLMGRVCRDRRGQDAGVSQFFCNERGNGFFFAAFPGDGHHLCDKTNGRVLVEQIAGQRRFSFGHGESIQIETRRAGCPQQFYAERPTHQRQPSR